MWIVARLRLTAVLVSTLIPVGCSWAATAQPDPGSIAAPAPGAGAQDQASPSRPGTLKTLKDWTVGCDNLRACTAIGLMSSEDGLSYIRVVRSGGADDLPTVTFTFGGAGDLPPADIHLMLDGEEQPLQPVRGAKVPSAALPAASLDAFLPKLIQAKSLVLSLVRGDKRLRTATVSLEGSAAALLYIDDQQKRIGTTTALTKKGEAPASSIPGPPEATVVEARPISKVSADKPPRPPGLPMLKDEGCKGIPDIVVRLEPGITAWGLCSTGAAYNIKYRFWFGDTNGVKPADFTIAGQSSDDPGNTLTLPYVSDDGRRLASTDLGRGIGDCGTATEWGWNGTAFKLIKLSRMDECRGVFGDDWPVLFESRMHAAAGQ